MAGYADALNSFAYEAELHHPTRGRVKGSRAFKDFVTTTNAWLGERNVAVDDVHLIATGQRRPRKSSFVLTATTVGLLYP